MDFSKIEKLRKYLRLNQSEVAFKMGISTGGFQNIIYSGNTTVKNLEKLSDALGVSPAYWWKEDEDPESVMEEIPTRYEIDLKSELNKLRKQHEKDQTTIENLNDHIADLKEKLNQTGHKERKAG